MGFTSYVQREKAAGRHFVTLVLRTDVTTGPQASFQSRQAASELPDLAGVP